MHTENKNVRRERSHRTLPIVLGVIWGIMLVLYVRSIYGIFHYDQTYNYYSDPTYSVDEAVVGNYGAIYSRIDNMIESRSDFDLHTEYSELVAIHDYLEAAVHHRMYSENGLDDLAAKNLARMDEARSRMGGLDFVADDIDSTLR